MNYFSWQWNWWINIYAKVAHWDQCYLYASFADIPVNRKTSHKIHKMWWIKHISLSPKPAEFCSTFFSKCKTELEMKGGQLIFKSMSFNHWMFCSHSTIHRDKVWHCSLTNDPLNHEKMREKREENQSGPVETRGRVGTMDQLSAGKNELSGYL